ncbi:MAG: insulinase family protein [Desulfovibrionaceae bacterium]|nr:insulinase family protein [Desulfovibrionaceae bacterium]
MNTHGFVLAQKRELSEVGGTASLWRHEATGAELLSVCNRDANKCFGVTFRTPPDTSTGVPHILEHSVLCGSEKYPVHEPFVELLKGSLQTFLNAFTFPDKTCYPVASANLQDFRNLVDVYLDAVFFPLIPENVFRQEGWHVETDAADPVNGPLSYKGVVFNEMKGVYSSPDSILEEESQHALFPDNTYGLDSGGNPAVIPTLSYAAFRAFHKELYHPSNARFFFWGDDPEEGRFEMLAPYLERFTRGRPGPMVPLQPEPELPRLVEVPFAAGPGERSGHVAMNWLLCETADTEELFALEMLTHILQGLPGSPLRRALIESGLGEDLAGCGLATDLRQAYYSVGLRSVKPDDAQKVEVLILDTLAELAESGVPQDAVDAALNSLEFHLRENNTGSFPRGLSAMIACLSTWLHDGDPFGPLAWEIPLASLKKRLASGEKVFEAAIRRWFLDKPAVTVLLLPDAGLAARREQEEQARLDRVQASLSAGEREELAREVEAFHASQREPDSTEALASIPSLTLADLPRENARIPSEEGMAGPARALLHELDTTGIVYPALLLPLCAVPAELMPLLPLYARSLTEMGTARHSFVEFGTLIASRTGGLSAGPSFISNTAGEPLAHLVVSGKATAEKAGGLFDLMAEMLLEPAFDNQPRFMQMVLEERARLEQGLIPAGHQVVSSRLRASQSTAGWLNELTSGVLYLEFMRRLADRVSSDWPGVLADLRRLHGLAARQNGALFNITADGAGLKAALPAAARLAEKLPALDLPDAAWTPSSIPDGEALLVPAQVNYVGMGCNLYASGYRWHGSASVASRHLRMAWLWNQVRVQGGAYGAFCALDRITGAAAQVSYRDPNVDKTLDAYKASAEYLKGLELPARDLELAIVGAIGDMDAYQLPDAQGWTALMRHLTGDTEEARQQRREEVLGCTMRHFHAFGEALAEAMKKPVVCVLGGSAAADAAKAHGWAVKKLL